MAKIYTVILLLFGYYTLISYDSLPEILHNNFFIKYQRPITILYISNNPEFFSINTKNIIVVWGNSSSFYENLKRQNCSNYIMLSDKIIQDNLVSLAECEHFDIAIIDVDLDFSLIQKSAHLADHTIIITSKKLQHLTKIDADFEKNIFLLSKTKISLLKNWWKSTSFHKNYTIISSFEEKFLLKPKEYSQDNQPRKYPWRPGINLYTFFSLKGVYPSMEWVREKVLEVFNPLTHKDFGAANIIIQGLHLKAIDYDDTNYLEDPYARLQRTLEQQLKLKYK